MIRRRAISALGRLLLVSALAAMAAPPLLGERVGGGLVFSGLAVAAAAMVLRRGPFAPLDRVEGFMALLVPAAAVASTVPWGILQFRPPPPEACATPLGLLGTVAPPYLAALVAVAVWVAVVLRLWRAEAFANFDAQRAPPLRAVQLFALTAGLALLVAGALAAVLNAACKPGPPVMAIVVPFLAALSTGFASLYVIVALAGHRH